MFDKRITDRILLEVKVNPNIKSFEQLAKATGLRRESFYYSKYDSIRDGLAKTFAQRSNRKPYVRKMNKKIRRL